MPAKIAVQATPPTAARSEQLLVPILSEDHPKYGRIAITPDVVARMASNFAAQVKTYHGKLPFTVEHDDQRGAAGWITGVRTDERGLHAAVEWTPTGVEAIANNEFPFLSPEWLPTWRDPRTGTVHHDVLNGASLVVRPEFRDLPPARLAFSEGGGPVVLVFEEDIMPDQVVDPTATGTTTHTDLGTADGQGSGAAPDHPAMPPAAPAAADAAQTFAEPDDSEVRRLREEVATLRRRDNVRLFGEQFEALTFGEGQRLTPVTRNALAEFGADLHEVSPELAQRFGELLGGLQLYRFGEVGLSLSPAAAPRALSAEEQSVAAQLGLSEEDMR